MRHGVYMFLTTDGLSAPELASRAESLGFESMWVPEHTHIPVEDPTVDYPDFPDGGPLPSYYSRTLDPFVALSAAAATTQRIRLGFGICLLVQRDPITTAKELASLDVISGGRVLLGIGPGWNRREMSNHGIDPRTRLASLRERVDAMKAIWTQEPAEYHGRFVDFDPIWAEPKPVQRPHPPIYMAGMGPTVLDRVVDGADGWLPEPHEGLFDRIAQLRELAREKGKAAPRVTVFTADPAHVEEYEAAGVERCVFALTPCDAGAAVDELETLASTLRLSQ